ncbi:hypothetical protein TVAG_224730 [Trichomonas vaginalis G3]|uniref:Uncharacterized protein n=1 Tax=Trichomonas vaginalis (strain ATCC PRA-98 / G3) TaxID=412133 RepID=A2DW96_TRIV3|nr:hypothetical protein TVAGG3_0804140 [Trichomonas vaginalis G3]EAY15397.1 hypothetical protein TVAG_224730 [Trichomonas vaginalis G3]KAI5496728.1 hypothetical protein TVAGG3_0804140 [Trichomonas vaginalis G3]|eukprot:XP_001327620.1 hypothetical protein [Trichomonas vaginalis G3]
MRKKTLRPHPHDKNRNLIFFIVCCVILVAAYRYKRYRFISIEVPRIKEICPNTDVTIKQFHNKFCFVAKTLPQLKKPRLAFYKLFSISIGNSWQTVKYPYNTPESISGSYPETTFCLYHQFPEEVEINISCSNQLIKTDKALIKDVDLSNDGSSNVRVNDPSMFVSTDFCVENENEIIFLSKQDISTKTVSLSPIQNITFDVRNPKTFIKWPTDKWTTVFAYAASRKPWMVIVSTLIPLFKNNILINNGIKLKRFGILKEEHETYFRLSEQFKEDTHHRCFGFGVFAKIPNIEKSDYFEFIYNLTLSYPSNVIHSFRDLLAKSKMRKKKIVVDEYFARDYPQVMNTPQYEVVVLNQSDPIYKIADTIHSSKYYVFSHLTTAIYSIFLSKDAKMIERKINGADCLKIGKQISKLVGCGYKELKKPINNDCSIKSLQEYIEKLIDFSENNYLQLLYHNLGIQ